MPVQVAANSLAKKLGAQITQAHQEHKDKPIDRGMVRLPAGIKNGIAQLTSAYISQYKDGDNKGKDFFRASGSIKIPKEVAGMSVEGLHTSMMIPLFEEPAKGLRKLKTFSDQWFEFQNWFKIFGVDAPDAKKPGESEMDSAVRIENYYLAAMRVLCGDPNGKTEAEKKGERPHFNFSTRGWTPKPTAQQPKPTEMVFEEWHGKCEFNDIVDPATNGMTNGQTVMELQPESFTEPPMGVTEHPVGTNGQHQPDTTTAAPPETPVADDLADEVQTLLQMIDADPQGETEDGVTAMNRLGEMAIASGATQEQVAAGSWEDVAAMALGITSDAPAVPDPVVGGKYSFRKRGNNGQPLAGKDGQPFKATEIELISVDLEARTCTAKDKTGKVIADLKKNPIHIKFEWLE